MEKGYYGNGNGKNNNEGKVAIHNKNGKGLLQVSETAKAAADKASQSTIKMEKGYYTETASAFVMPDDVAIHNKNGKGLLHQDASLRKLGKLKVAIHNKNGKGLLRIRSPYLPSHILCRNPQ